MDLGAVVLQVRAANTRFGNRVAGAAELAVAMESSLLEKAAFVVQVGDSAPPNDSDSGITQRMTERFAVIVALENDNDKRDKTGFLASDKLHDVRQELFVALLGWQVPGTDGLVYYSAGRLIDLDRAWLWYQFEFEAVTYLSAQYDPNAGSLPELQKIFSQWKVGGDNVLPLPDGSTLPTDLLKEPVLEELIELPHAFDDGFSKGFDTIKKYER